MAQIISWKSKTSYEKLYNGSPKATDLKAIISVRMLNLDGHCIQLEINGITLIKKWYNPVAPWYTIYGITN